MTLTNSPATRQDYLPPDGQSDTALVDDHIIRTDGNVFGITEPQLQLPLGSQPIGVAITTGATAAIAAEATEGTSQRQLQSATRPILETAVMEYYSSAPITRHSNVQSEVPPSTLTDLQQRDRRAADTLVANEGAGTGAVAAGEARFARADRRRSSTTASRCSGWCCGAAAAAAVAARPERSRRRRRIVPGAGMATARR